MRHNIEYTKHAQTYFVVQHSGAESFWPQFLRRHIPREEILQPWRQRDSLKQSTSMPGIVMATPEVEASCAICGAPPYPECPHEGERLEIALNQAMQKWSGFTAIR